MLDVFVSYSLVRIITSKLIHDYVKLGNPGNIQTLCTLIKSIRGDITHNTLNLDYILYFSISLELELKRSYNSICRLKV